MLSVFLVEDSPVVQTCIEGMLEDIGCRLAGVANGEPEALAGIAATIPDVVVLDLYIDNGSGFSVLKQVKARYPHICVLVLTNLNGQAMVERCREYGADDFFDKTSDFDRLEQALLSRASSRTPNAS